MPGRGGLITDHFLARKRPIDQHPAKKRRIETGKNVNSSILILDSFSLQVIISRTEKIVYLFDDAFVISS